MNCAEGLLFLKIRSLKLIIEENIAPKSSIRQSDGFFEILKLMFDVLTMRHLSLVYDPQ